MTQSADTEAPQLGWLWCRASTSNRSRRRSGPWCRGSTSGPHCRRRRRPRSAMRCCGGAWCSCATSTSRPPSRWRSAGASASSRPPIRCRAGSTTSTRRSSCSTAGTTPSASATGATARATTTAGTPTSRSRRRPRWRRSSPPRRSPPRGGDTLWADLVGAYAIAVAAGPRGSSTRSSPSTTPARTFDRFQDDGEANRSRLAALAPGAAPGGAGAPRDRRARAVRQPGRSRRTSRACRQARERDILRPPVRAHHHARARRALALAGRRRRDVGQPGDGPLRRRRLRRAATDAPDHGRRRPTGRRERTARLTAP